MVFKMQKIKDTRTHQLEYLTSHQQFVSHEDINNPSNNQEPHAVN